MNPRIAFAGASATGKTTLAQFVAEKFSVPLNPVGSRSTALSMGFNNPYDVDRANAAAYRNAIAQGGSPEAAAEHSLKFADFGKENLRETFQKKLQADKIAWENEHMETGFVTDRSIFDDYCYLALHNIYALTDEFRARAIEHFKKYNAVFFCPILAFQSLGDDPRRLKVDAYHKTFEDLLFHMCMSQGRYGDGPIVEQIFERTLEDRKEYLDSNLNWRFGNGQSR